ncbi:MAG: hypothetical protein HY598_05170, partial [Candidatus Omnitrophica bacterium]|nr:hypothetical protein [Candidatus Omnitrophota bacterium]
VHALTMPVLVSAMTGTLGWSALTASVVLSAATALLSRLSQFFARGQLTPQALSRLRATTLALTALLVLAVDPPLTLTSLLTHYPLLISPLGLLWLFADALGSQLSLRLQGALGMAEEDVWLQLRRMREKIEAGGRLTDEDERILQRAEEAARSSGGRVITLVREEEPPAAETVAEKAQTVRVETSTENEERRQFTAAAQGALTTLKRELYAATQLVRKADRLLEAAKRFEHATPVADLRPIAQRLEAHLVRIEQTLNARRFEGLPEAVRADLGAFMEEFARQLANPLAMALQDRSMLTVAHPSASRQFASGLEEDLEQMHAWCVRVEVGLRYWPQASPLPIERFPDGRTRFNVETLVKAAQPIGTPLARAPQPRPDMAEPLLPRSGPPVRAPMIPPMPAAEIPAIREEPSATVAVVKEQETVQPERITVRPTPAVRAEDAADLRTRLMVLHDRYGYSWGQVRQAAPEPISEQTILHFANHPTHQVQRKTFQRLAAAVERIEAALIGPQLPPVRLVWAKHGGRPSVHPEDAAALRTQLQALHTAGWSWRAISAASDLHEPVNLQTISRFVNHAETTVQLEMYHKLWLVARVLQQEPAPIREKTTPLITAVSAEEVAGLRERLVILHEQHGYSWKTIRQVAKKSIRGQTISEFVANPNYRPKRDTYDRLEAAVSAVEVALTGPHIPPVRLIWRDRGRPHVHPEDAARLRERLRLLRTAGWSLAAIPTASHPHNPVTRRTLWHFINHPNATIGLEVYRKLWLAAHALEQEPAPVRSEASPTAAPKRGPGRPPLIDDATLKAEVIAQPATPFAQLAERFKVSIMTVKRHLRNILLQELAQRSQPRGTHRLVDDATPIVHGLRQALLQGVVHALTMPVLVSAMTGTLGWSALTASVVLSAATALL